MVLAFAALLIFILFVIWLFSGEPGEFPGGDV